MTARPLRPAAACALSGVLGMGCGIAHADVTLDRTLSIEGVGVMAVGNMSGTTRTTISGEKSRTDTDVQMKSKLVRLLARNSVGPSAEIVRLDQDRIYHLNMSRKEYTETTFEELRDQLGKVSGQPQQNEGKQQPAPIDESKCEWLPPKVEVKKTGEKSEIAGYEAQRVILTAAQPCKEVSTGSICELALSLDQWLAPGFKESAEVQKYYKAYAAKAGVQPTAAQDISQRAQAMFGRYKGIWGEISAKMQGAKGYPVKSSFTLAIGGPQCQSASARQTPAGESSGGSTPGGLKDQVANKLGSLFHKKNEAGVAAPPAPDSAAPAVPPGDVPLVTITSQLVSVSTSAAAPDAFEIPVGFRKEAPKAQ